MGGRFALVLFIVFLFVEILATGGIKTSMSTTGTTMGNFRRSEVVGSDGPIVHQGLDPYYMNKRKVPNGPDPIHNRRAGKSRQPPGRAPLG